MMCLLTYLLVGVVVAFFTYKKAEKQPLRYGWHTSHFQDSGVVVKVILTSAFWPILIPIIGLWKLLDYLYNKFNNKTQR